MLAQTVTAKEVASSLDWCESIAMQLGYKDRGAELDLDRAARKMIATSIDGGYGRISFQRPTDFNEIETRYIDQSDVK